MTLTRLALAAVLAAAGIERAGAQAPAPRPALPPLFYVRLAGPAGMKVTVYRGLAQGETLAAPATLGLRPGYCYAFALHDIPGLPGVSFSPTLEVRGSLLLNQQLRNADFPAALNFSMEDFTRTNEALVKKVIVLERPDSAVPQAAKADQPITINLPPNRNPLTAAMERGQALAVLYLGERRMTPEELAARAIPGTMLLPGEKTLPMPKYPPWVPWACFPLVDPVVGAEHPAHMVTIPDGGDSGLRAGYDSFGRLRGVDPSDTVAEYQDSKGRQRIAVSNRVCLCVPRFVILQSDTVLGNQVASIGPGSAQGLKGFARYDSLVPIVEYSSQTLLESAANRQKTSGASNLYGTAVTGRIDGVEVRANLNGPMTLDGRCPPPEVVEPLDRPLIIIKWPEKCGAQIGDLITFHLKYTNQGGRPISNIAISDSLAPRFEYVPGSAKADREATFTFGPNEAGSTILRWEFPGELLPRESGLVSFQVRVR